MDGGPTRIARSLAAAGCLAAASLSSVPASGQAPSPAASPPPVGNDVVYLKGGGIVRGTLVDVIPGQAARVQLVTGEISTIPWADVDHVVAAAGAPATGPASTPQAPPDAEGMPPPRAAQDEPPAQGAAMIRLHVDAPREVELFGRPQTGDADWAPVCRGDCDQPVRLDWQYEVRGAGLRDSKTFTLGGATGGATVVSVDPASKGMFILGIVSLGVGLNGAIVGASLILAGELASTTEATAGNGNLSAAGDRNTGHDLVSVGSIVTVLGVAALIGGSLATFNNVHTGVKVSSPGEAQAARVVLPRFESARETPRLPPVLGVPLVTLRF